MLIALFVAHGLCNLTDAFRPASIERKDDAPIISHLKVDEFFKIVGLDPELFETCELEAGDENFCCTPKPGPDRLDCPGAISAWDDLAENSYIHVNGGQCITATNKRCRASVCALAGDLKVHVNEIIGGMWNPLSIKCVLGGKGGILGNEDLKFFIEMGTPQ
ncbi:hypothetical protein EDB81DRAFT_878146 [Dactylonectria macrodidyma]|uniref:Uncharacterized protein n=1 Tax=Dactylonectria macrodidyma TaxID=307937 RepID=A0A9P9FM99_9HYPO|nr:hypothetical protein EDB81DRAFT_878146 [Dactylonectria macrodidyma]